MVPNCLTNAIYSNDASSSMIKEYTEDWGKVAKKRSMLNQQRKGNS